MKKIEKYVKSDGVKLWCQLCYKKMTDIPCLLISGAGASAMFWSDHFCEILVKRGYRVIRFDHRDQGLSDAVCDRVVNKAYQIEVKGESKRRQKS